MIWCDDMVRKTASSANRGGRVEEGNSIRRKRLRRVESVVESELSIFDESTFCTSFRTWDNLQLDRAPSALAN